MLSTVEDAIYLLTIQMSTAATALTNEGMESAVDTATKELGFSIPLNDPSKEMWLIKRAVRHACYILWVASAQKFKYKQVNLNQRFEHYEKLLKQMDTEYEKALAEDSSVFSSVESYKQFGTAVNAGFRYDGLGNDITYSDLELYINSEG